MRKIFYLLFLSIFCLLQAPKLQGQVSTYEEGLMEGYTLYQTFFSDVYLVDNCGRIVNHWEMDGDHADFHPKLLPNGNLIYIKDGANSVIERDWDDNKVHEVTVSGLDGFLNYEVIKLPSNNYLCLGREWKTNEEFIEMGYDIDGFKNPDYVDVVVELDYNTGEVVWMWNIADHALQQRDPSLNNYAIAKDNPQLLDMDRIGVYDWNNGESFMINGFDYNPTLDQIMLSVRKMGEVVIIDHSTTTEEAAGSTGGNSGKGGDILYRWGNPQNYGQGTANDRYLFYQHNPNWIEYGEHKDAIIMYNNGLNRPGVLFDDRYSSVPIVETSIGDNGEYILEPDMPFGNVVPLEDYSRVTTDNIFYSSYTSGGTVLPNGNIYITIGKDDKVMELTPDAELVWEYELPFGDYVFRTVKYPTDFPAFDGKDLTPGATITGQLPTVEPCIMIPDGTNDLVERQFKVWYSADNSLLHIEPVESQDFQFIVYDSSGKRQTFGRGNGNTQHSLEQLVPGMYAVQILDLKEHRQETIKIIKP